jgi:hypothetical protein
VRRRRSEELLKSWPALDLKKCHIAWDFGIFWPVEGIEHPRHFGMSKKTHGIPWNPMDPRFLKIFDVAMDQYLFIPFLGG